MSSELAIGGTPLELRVNRAAKTLRLRVDGRTRRVILTVPARVSRRRALEWAAGHGAWVEQTLSMLPERTPLGDGGTVPLCGRAHRIVSAPHEPRRIAADGEVLRVGGPADGLERRLTRWLREQARLRLTAETAEFARMAGVAVTRVSVGDPRSRWGSCSSSGAIRYSWRLILAPDFVRRATVAHEVAHRVHMNHGPAFHALVAELVGADAARAREWLRREGASLHRIGAA